MINSDGYIFAGTNLGVYRSTNNGETWGTINNGLDLDNGLYVQCLAANSDHFIFAGTLLGGIYRSSDNGNNWIQINNSLAFNSVSALACYTNGTIFAGTDQAIIKSTDNGNTWNQTSLSGKIFSLAINSNGDIFAGTYGEGVYRSTNGGYDWEMLNVGLTNHFINSLTINSDGFIFCGTNANGVFRSINSTTSINDKDLFTRKFNLVQNYPNPFNPSTSISYSLPERQFVSLKVYDILGNDINTLVYEDQSAGQYIVKFNAENLPSGVYFYTLRSGNFSKTKKLILLK